MEYHLTTNEPCVVRDAIVKWLVDSAERYRVQARIGNTKRHARERTAQAEALEAAGKFVANIRITKPE